MLELSLKMEENDFVRNHHPRLSFSTISDITLDSSAASHVNVNSVVSSTNNFAIDNFVRDLNGAAQNNFKIQSSSGIRVGDAIYNIYYPPPTLDGSVPGNSRSVHSKFKGL